MAISKRGAALSQIAFDHGLKNEYDEVTNPTGVVNLLYAENRLMHEDLAEFINTQAAHFEPTCCSYSEGYTGSYRFRQAIAAHLNEYFTPFKLLDPENVTVAAGVTALNEACALVTCEPDSRDAILLGRYNYGAFPTDLVVRTGVSLAYASFDGSDQFSPSCVRYYEKAFEKAKQEGLNVKALLICNPNNPLGRCYTRDGLVEIMKFCESKSIHLISDEIYALSVYQRPDRRSDSFVSALSIDPAGLIDHARVHILYGLSKDYGAGGLRLGWLISYNEAFTNAVRGGVCRFSSPSIFSMHIATKFLEDRDFVRAFLRKSADVLLKQRLLTETLLDEAGIGYSHVGNAGLFVWLDLRPFLRPHDTAEDLWAAERLLQHRLTQHGVLMSTGERYLSEEPGHFRMNFSYPEPVVREAVRRISTACKA